MNTARGISRGSSKRAEEMIKNQLQKNEGLVYIDPKSDKESDFVKNVQDLAKKHGRESSVFILDFGLNQTRNRIKKNRKFKKR